MSSIYVQHDGKQLGPFSEAEIKAQLAVSAISVHDFVWWQGQKDWVPLSQTALMPGGVPIPPPPGGTLPPGVGAVPPSSKVATWALVCGCLSLVCGIFASIPAIILGHMGLAETKKNPALSGRGMALAGTILGYVFTAFFIVYLTIVGISVAIALGNQVKGQHKSIFTPTLPASSDDTTNSPDDSTNSAPASTNAPDQSTNSAPAPTNSPDTSTNSPTATPMNQ